MTVVLLPWVHDLPWKVQSRLLSSLRGPDTRFCFNVKKVSKLLRAATQHDADPDTDYMKDTWPPNWKELERELEFCPLHYVCHLIEGLTTVERHCPEAEYAARCTHVLVWIRDTFHLAYVGE